MAISVWTTIEDIKGLGYYQSWTGGRFRSHIHDNDITTRRTWPDHFSNLPENTTRIHLRYSQLDIVPCSTIATVADPENT